MRKICIFICLLILVVCMMSYAGEIEPIVDIGSFINPAITTIDLTGQWIIIGYSINTKGIQTVELGIEFNTPEKDKVKIVTGSNYTVYPFSWDKGAYRINIDGCNYFYIPQSKDILLFIEFPVLTKDKIYGFYQVYFLVKRNVYDEVVPSIAQWYDDFFLIRE